MENKLNLVELLDYIDPATLNYQEWLNVGFALKHEGYSIDDWDNWSRRDMARYHDGETEKKWEKFNGSAKPVTGAGDHHQAIRLALAGTIALLHLISIVVIKL